MQPSSYLGGGGDGASSSSSSSPWQQQQHPQQQQSSSNEVSQDVIRWYQNQQNGQIPSQGISVPSYPAFPPSQPSYPLSNSEHPQHQDKQDSSTGPIRQRNAVPTASSSAPSKVSRPDDRDNDSPGNTNGGGGDAAEASSSSTASKSAPVRAACLFCRARKSRCNGQQPCHNCINRAREDDCVYTMSRRGGKPKPKPNQSQEEANLEQHLKRLFTLSQLPQQVRVPGAIPSLQDAQHSQDQRNDAKAPKKFHATPPSQPAPQLTHPAQQSKKPQPPPVAVSQQPAFVSSTDQQMMASNFPYSAAPNKTLVPSHTLGLANNIANQSWDPMTALYSAMNQSYGSNLSSTDMTASSSISIPAPLLVQPSVAPRHAEYFPPSNASNWAGQQQEQRGMQDQHRQAPIVGSQQGNLTYGTDASTSGHTAFPAQTSVYNILLGYYNSLYRFIPVFAPPEYIHEMSQKLSIDSPFILALQAILPLLQDGDVTSAAPSTAEDGSDSGGAFSAGFGIGPGNSGLSFPSPERKAELLTITSYYEKRATDTIEYVLEQAETHLQGSGQPLTGKGTTIGVIQALVVLCVYHYGSGRALKARLKADQALGIAMAKGLHRLRRPKSDSTSPSHAKSSFVSSDDVFGTKSLYSDLPARVRYEMDKRIWWVCWSSSLWCSYNTAIVPTVRADDPRVTTEMPIAHDPAVWAANIRSLQSLLLIQERVLALATLKDGGEEDGVGSVEQGNEGTPLFSRSRSDYAQSSNGTDENSCETQRSTFASLPSNASRRDVLESMLEIDRSLQEQIAEVEADTEGFQQLCREPTSVTAQGEGLLNRVDEDLTMYLKRSSAIQLYTSSLTLHLGQAFQGASLFERKLCFLNTVTENDSSAACQVPMPDSFSSTFGLPVDDEDIASTLKTNGARKMEIFQSQSGGASASTSAQDLFARGPFLPKDSLRRCVHASKRLLEIARSKRKEPNPFNACSYVLISFTLLMQALAVSSSAPGEGSEGRGEADEDEEEDETEDNDHDVEVDYDAGDFDMNDVLGGVSGGTAGYVGSSEGPAEALTHHADLSAFSRGLLQSAQGAAALGGSRTGSIPQQRQTLFDFSSSSSGHTQPPSWDFFSAIDGAAEPGLAVKKLNLDRRDNTTTNTNEAVGPNSAAALRRREKLREIWSRVGEAHATLKELSKYWKMVEPMADEVSLCLETSQLLLQQ